MSAEMKIWMLTGDKRETAVNIAHASTLITSRTTLFIVDRQTYEETYERLQHYTQKTFALPPNHEFSMAIEGTVSFVISLIGSPIISCII